MIGIPVSAVIVLMAVGPAGPPLFDTPAWQSSGRLSLRSAPEGGLLLRHEPSGAVYLYTEKAERLQPIPKDRWEDAGGIVADCDSQSPPRPSELAIRSRAGDLAAGKRRVPVAGGAALLLRQEPGGRRVAVLSAGGRRQPRPFSEDLFEGPLYHQIVVLPEGWSSGPPVALPLKPGDVAIELCWSPDRRYIVYHDLLFFQLSIVPVGKGDVP